MYERLFLSLDGTPEAETALPEVEKLLRAQSTPTTLVLVRVGPPVDAAAAVEEMKRGTNFSLTDRVPDAPGDEDPLLTAGAERELTAYLDKVSKRLRQFGTTIVTEVSFRDPAAEILYFANYHKVDLIVMATHGRRGLNRLLHGSVTETVMEHTPCPMLVVRVPVGDQPVRQ